MTNLKDGHITLTDKIHATFYSVTVWGIYIFVSKFLWLLFYGMAELGEGSLCSGKIEFLCQKK